MKLWQCKSSDNSCVSNFVYLSQTRTTMPPPRPLQNGARRFVVIISLRFYEIIVGVLYYLRFCTSSWASRWERNLQNWMEHNFRIRRLEFNRPRQVSCSSRQIQYLRDIYKLLRITVSTPPPSFYITPL